MPFDWKTPIGYLISCVLQSFSSFLMSVNCCCVLIFMTGVSFILISIIEDIGREFASQTSFGNEKQKNLMKFKKNFFKTFQFYCDSKQYNYKLTID